jgi:hypothetical protein
MHKLFRVIHDHHTAKYRAFARVRVYECGPTASLTVKVHTNLGTCSSHTMCSLSRRPACVA